MFYTFTLFVLRFSFAFYLHFAFYTFTFTFVVTVQFYSSRHTVYILRLRYVWLLLLLRCFVGYPFTFGLRSFGSRSFLFTFTVLRCYVCSSTHTFGFICSYLFTHFLLVPVYTFYVCCCLRLVYLLLFYILLFTRLRFVYVFTVYVVVAFCSILLLFVVFVGLQFYS